MFSALRALSRRSIIHPSRLANRKTVNQTKAAWYYRYATEIMKPLCREKQSGFCMFSALRVLSRRSIIHPSRLENRKTVNQTKAAWHYRYVNEIMKPLCREKQSGFCMFSALRALSRRSIIHSNRPVNRQAVNQTKAARHYRYATEIMKPLCREKQSGFCMFSALRVLSCCSIIHSNRLANRKTVNQTKSVGWAQRQAASYC